MKKITAFL